MGLSEILILAVPASIAVIKLTVIALAVAWVVKGIFQPTEVKLKING